jgi:hypothetical protein
LLKEPGRKYGGETNISLKDLKEVDTIQKKGNAVRMRRIAADK